MRIQAGWQMTIIIYLMKYQAISGWRYLLCYFYTNKKIFRPKKTRQIKHFIIQEDYRIRKHKSKNHF